MKKQPTIHHEAHPDFNVEDYALVTILDLQPEFGGPQGYAHYLMTGGTPCKPVGRCGHCGTHLRYAAVMVHLPTREHIMVGEDCLHNRFSGAHEDFTALRECAKARALKAKKIGKLEVFLQENPDFRPLVECQTLWDTHGEFVADVVCKLMQHGELTDNQVAAVRNAIERKARWAAQRAEEALTMVPAPTGRVTFTGTIATVKVENGFGYNTTVTKLLVVADDKYKVWVTAPRDLLFTGNGPTKGQRVTMVATLTQSAKDATFAIGKRPMLLNAAA